MASLPDVGTLPIEGHVCIVERFHQLVHAEDRLTYRLDESILTLRTETVHVHAVFSLKNHVDSLNLFLMKLYKEQPKRYIRKEIMEKTTFGAS